jgi:hypothetical protein
VKEPDEEEWVFQIATEISDTVILKISNCTNQDKWEDKAVPYKPGSSSSLGQDVTCVDFNECDFKLKYIAELPNATKDYTCGDLSVCSDLAREKKKPAFPVINNTEMTDRVCSLCSEWSENGDSKFKDSFNFNASWAAVEYQKYCIDLVEQSMTTGAKVAIGVVGLVALGSIAGVAFVVRKKRQLAAARELTELEVDKAKDDLELNENMVRNPLQGPNPSQVDAQALSSANSMKDAEILKLREEIRRLKMVLQKDSHSDSFKRVQLSSRQLSSRKKQFGQSSV